MQIKLASKRGFCFGVEDAIELAERTVIEDKGRVVALGPLIHNRQVVERLEQAVLNQSGTLERIGGDTAVLIRSHGAPPDPSTTVPPRITISTSDIISSTGRVLLFVDSILARFRPFSEISPPISMVDIAGLERNA